MRNAFILIPALCLLAACASPTGDGGEAPPADPGAEPGAEPTPSAQTVQVAFAGGGWRAHTAHAAWIMSLLEGGKYTLDDVFGNVDALGSNSGGSWFLTMLAYSDAFQKSIEGADAFENYPTTGYLGLQEKLLEKIPKSSDCTVIPKDDTFLRFYCRLAGLTDHDLPVWNDIVQDVVFEPFGMATELDGRLLSGKRNSWADGKSLVMAATILTDQAVLNENDFLDKLYYDAQRTTTGPTQTTVTPLAFASVASGLTAPDFLSAGGFDLHYTENAIFDPSKADASIDNPLATEQVPVMVAAAASSAAAGAAASHTVVEDNGYDFAWQIAYELSDLALPFSLTPPISLQSAADLTVQELADADFVRLADGGYADNTGVAHLVNFLQANGKGDGFDIVAFDNVTSLYTPDGGNGAPIGVDLANLFGKGLAGPNNDQICVGSGSDQVCVTVPSPQIFEVTALQSTKATWQWSPDSTMSPANWLIYTKYSVTTVENGSLGITPGSTGTLHAFSCAWPTAATAPFDGQSDFEAYKAMFDGIRMGLEAEQEKGLLLLSAALQP